MLGRLKRVLMEPEQRDKKATPRFIILQVCFFHLLLALQLQTVRYILQHGAQDVISYATIKTTGARCFRTAARKCSAC